jgi:hypothetical protein
MRCAASTGYATSTVRGEHSGVGPQPIRQGWARVPPHIAWKFPGLPTEWTHVLERNEEAMRPEPLPGYVWLESAPAEQAVSCLCRAPGVLRW